MFCSQYMQVDYKLSATPIIKKKRPTPLAAVAAGIVASATRGPRRCALKNAAYAACGCCRWNSGLRHSRPSPLCTVGNSTSNVQPSLQLFKLAACAVKQQLGRAANGSRNFPPTRSLRCGYLRLQIAPLYKSGPCHGYRGQASCQNCGSFMILHHNAQSSAETPLFLPGHLCSL